MRCLRLAPVLLLCSCAIAARSDKFGADLELSVGGILSYIVDLKLKANVGFSKTFPVKENSDGETEGNDGSDPLGLAYFL